MRTFLFPLLAFLAFVAVMIPSASRAQNFCWVKTDIRLASANRCPRGAELEGGRCFERCPRGWNGALDTCWTQCRGSAREVAAICAQVRVPYKREGFGSQRECQRRTGSRSCRKRWGVSPSLTSLTRWYAPCKAGYREDGPFCKALQVRIIGRQVRPRRSYGWASCPPGFRGPTLGLCERNCRRDQTEVGILCASRCPAGWVSCGFGCARSTGACVSAVTNQVVTVLSTAADIAGIAATGGTSAVAKAGAKAAFKAALRKSAQVMKKYGRKQVRKYVRELGRRYRTTFRNPDAIVDAMMGGDPPNHLLDAADVIGVVKIAKAYAKPICQANFSTRNDTRNPGTKNPGVRTPIVRTPVVRIPPSDFQSKTGVTTFEAGINRPGSDYRNFSLGHRGPALCQIICAQEQHCRAWTYTRPGIAGPAARCYLKHAAPAPQRNGCCTSGVRLRRPVIQPDGNRIVRFNYPRINGAFVDQCATWATNCGRGGADQYCRTRGYARAVTWSIQQLPRTWVVGSRRFCAPGCKGFRYVTCTR